MKIYCGLEYYFDTFDIFTILTTAVKKYYAMIHVDSSSFITHTSLIVSSYKIIITCINISTKISS